MFSYVHKVSAEVQDLGDRLDHVENKIGEFTTTFNTTVDAHEAKKYDITWM